ncbi:hypothetical protein N9064_00695 [bacterium]|nr:hypothetical protein [bacterium]
MAEENTEIEEVEEVVKEKTEEEIFQENLIGRLNAPAEVEETAVVEEVVEPEPEPEEVDVEETATEEAKPEVEEQPALTEDRVKELLAQQTPTEVATPAVEKTEAEQLAELREKIGYSELNAEDVSFLSDLDIDDATRAKKLNELFDRKNQIALRAAQEMISPELEAQKQWREQQEQQAAQKNQQILAQAAQDAFYSRHKDMEDFKDIIPFVAQKVEAEAGPLKDNTAETYYERMDLIANAMREVAKKSNISPKAKSKISPQKAPPALSNANGSGGGVPNAKPVKKDSFLSGIVQRQNG